MIDGLIYLGFMLCILFALFVIATLLCLPMSKLADQWYLEIEKGGWDE